MFRLNNQGTQSMNSKTISAENLGPIESFEFSPKDPGVTVLVAPNGSGKSILLEAVQAAARGKGKLPLRDRTRRGYFQAFGATITIGGTCRHTGGFEVTHLEGRFDLAELVDPQLQTPSSADNVRIKALVNLTGVKASSNLFKTHAAFEDFESVVTAPSIETDDLVVMAAKIKAAYDSAALQKERYAENQSGQATSLSPPADMDLDDESDSAILQSAYDNARDVLTRLQEQLRNANDHAKRISESQELLTRLNADGLIKDRDALVLEIQSARKAKEVKNTRITELQQEIKTLQTEISHCCTVIVTSETRLHSINESITLVDAAKATMNLTAAQMPVDSDITDAEADVALAKAAVEQGVQIRNALANAAKAQEHRAEAKNARAKAEKYRDAAKATDEVLSNTIKCPQLRVESDGKSARLVTDTERGKSIPYHDLSEGERWTLAIDIGADQVGEGGLLVISQVGWEGIDGKNRLAIHQHAVNRGVYILTAEAASDPEATREIIPTPMPHVEPTVESVPAPKLTAASAIPAAPAAKPKPKAKAVAPPVEATDEDIPF